MHDSPHACRWINSLAGRGWDLHLFPFRAYQVLPTLQGVTVHRPFLRMTREQLRDLRQRPLRQWWAGLKEAEAAHYPARLPHESIFPLPITFALEARLDRIMVSTGESDARTSALYGAPALARLIRKLRPDLIHSMEFQHCGYRVLRARELLRGARFPPWLATNWGSDIYHYRKDEQHRTQIQRLLRHIDFYSCECARDVTLARELGMTAKVMPVLPNSGGFELAATAALRDLLPPSRRRLIMIKGYQHFAGRALTALDAVARCADVVKDFEVVLFSCVSEQVIARVAELRASTPIKSITVLPRVTHEQMLRMQSLARVYLAVSVSDAISTSALEAMAMGAFPIQTDTSCCDEWFEPGRGGYLIPADDVDLIAQRVRSALTDDHLVDQAALLNWEVIASRLDQREMGRRIAAFYDRAFADLDQARGAEA